MNFVEQNYLLQSLIQHSWFMIAARNNMSLPSAAARCSPPHSCSSLSFSSSSPIKSECSSVTHQHEPLNLCVRDAVLFSNPDNNKIRKNPEKCFQNGALFAPGFGFFDEKSDFYARSLGVTTVSNNSKSNINVSACRRRSNGSSGNGQQHHRKSRIFKCNQCQETFSCLASLSEHTTQQHGGYKCHVCDTSFTQRSNLQRHALRHVGFKPYQCAECFKEYYRKDHLIRHISFNHPSDNPKLKIVQKLASSESLKYIESQHNNLQTVSPHVVSSPEENMSIKSETVSTTDGGDTGIEATLNVFLSEDLDVVN